MKSRSFAEPWPSDEHCIPAEEDMQHAPTPKCRCKPHYLGRNKAGKRVFAHRDEEEQVATRH